MLLVGVFLAPTATWSKGITKWMSPSWLSLSKRSFFHFQISAYLLLKVFFSCRYQEADRTRGLFVCLFVWDFKFFIKTLSFSRSPFPFSLDLRWDWSLQVFDHIVPIRDANLWFQKFQPPIKSTIQSFADVLLARFHHK